MPRRIRRRDFLNGAAMAIGGAFVPPAWLRALEDAPEKAAGYYPPARTGMRGSHEGSYKRNEFRHGSRVIVGYGGTFSIDSPAPYSA